MNYSLLWRFVNTANQECIIDMLEIIYSNADEAEIQIAQDTIDEALADRVTLSASREQREQVKRYEFGAMAVSTDVQAWLNGAHGNAIELEVIDGIVCKRN